MSAPKTREGRKAALAKRRDTMRTRPLGELRAEIERLGMKLHWSAGGRKDLDLVGWILRCAADFVSKAPVSDSEFAQLDLIRDALCDVRRGPIPFPARQVGAFFVDREGVAALLAAIEARNVRTAVEQEIAALDRKSGVVDAEVEALCTKALDRVGRNRGDERSREP